MQTPTVAEKSRGRDDHDYYNSFKSRLRGHLGAIPVFQALHSANSVLSGTPSGSNRPACDGS